MTIKMKTRSITKQKTMKTTIPRLTITLLALIHMTRFVFSQNSNERIIEVCQTLGEEITGDQLHLTNKK